MGEKVERHSSVHCAQGDNSSAFKRHDSEAKKREKKKSIGTHAGGRREGSSAKTFPLFVSLCAGKPDENSTFRKIQALSLLYIAVLFGQIKRF